MPNMVLTGARAIFKINGSKVAVATGCDFSSNIGYEEIQVLDQLEVFEFAEVRYRASFSATLVKIIGQDPTSLGWFPHIDLMSILTQPELVCEIWDSVSGLLVGVGEGIKPEGNSFNISAGAVTANNLTFVIKRFKAGSEANPGITPAAAS
jgi:hypothetical protein